MRYSIGDLAERTGLTVKAIRYYSDSGLVTADRNSAGHRRYGAAALARLQLVRTLRELGFPLATIRQVVAREVSLPEVAAVHAEVLAAQIRMLSRRRAVLLAVANCEETDPVIDEFLDAAFPGIDEGIRRSLTPELPDDPAPTQLQAWFELTELTQDPDFQASMRRMTSQYVVPGLRPNAAAVIRDHVTPAIAAGIDPASPQAQAVVTAVRRAVGEVEVEIDPRWDAYLRLVSVINGWSPPEPLAPAIDWFRQASGNRAA